MGKVFKEVFIFVAGTTPQIITETIYALSKRNPPIYPQKLYIITTSIGRKIIKNTIIKKGILESLFKEYNIPLVDLTDDSFIVPRYKNGKELDDIKDDKDNAIIGDLICSFIKERTREEDSRLHCSIAGGRKTMSFYLGVALQLFGRQRDKLYHVLVSPEFEANQEFFYKPKKNQIIKTPNGKRLNTKNAKVFLAELPFIRLRDKFPLSGRTFNELVSESQKEIDRAFICPPLNVFLEESAVQIGDVKIKIQPVHLALYTAFLERKLNCEIKGMCENCNACHTVITKAEPENTLLRAMAKYYKRIRPSKESTKKWDDPSLLRQYISKVNALIKKHLNNEIFSICYEIKAFGTYGNKRYGIALDKNRIAIK